MDNRNKKDISMVSAISKINYFLTSAGKLLAGRGLTCPSCGSAESTVVCRKYFVTAIRRCFVCQILFKSPTATAEENQSFYQSEYSEGFITDMPSRDQLEKLKASGFKGSDKDYHKYLEVLAAIGHKVGDSLFDYGCSWGYGSWQFAQADYTVSAYEISVPRCEYAKTNLGINSHSRLENVRGPFDIFFSAHVLEHVPSISKSIDFVKKVVRPGGWFVAFTPNGSNAFKERCPMAWKNSWGLVHPNLLDDKFYSNAFKSDTYLLASSPYDLESIKRWASSPQDSISLDLSGNELLIIAKLAEE